MNAEKLANIVVRHLGAAGLLAVPGKAVPLVVCGGELFPHMPATHFGCAHFDLERPTPASMIKPVLDEALAAEFEFTVAHRENQPLPVLRFLDESGPVAVVFAGESEQPEWRAWEANGFTVLDHRGMPRVDNGGAVIDRSLATVLQENGIAVNACARLNPEAVIFSGKEAPPAIVTSESGVDLYSLEDPVHHWGIEAIMEQYTAQSLTSVHLHFQDRWLDGVYCFNRGPFVAFVWPIRKGSAYATMFGVVDQRSLP
jgi:hypothetical protein